MEDKILIDERKRKAERIIELYACREYRQEDVARELGTPLYIVARVTEMYGYFHTKKITHENANEGQGVTMCVCFEDMGFLDNYNF